MARRWLPLARMIDRTGYTAIDGIRNFENRRIPLSLGSIKPLEGLTLHSVPNTWRLHELLLQDWLKWHVNVNRKCDGAGLLCILSVQRCWFTHPAVCCAGILICTMKSSKFG